MPPTSGPRVFNIISPSGKVQRMVFVRRVQHITRQIEYGLVPASLRARPPYASLAMNEGMELLSPEVIEDVPPGFFFFAERRACAMKLAPTLLDQLVHLGILAVIFGVHPKYGEHKRACLVKVLLKEEEISHACAFCIQNQEAPSQARFMKCWKCSQVPGRLGVYFCSMKCANERFLHHQVECGKSRSELEYLTSIASTIISPKPGYYLPFNHNRQASQYSTSSQRSSSSSSSSSSTSSSIILSPWKSNPAERLRAGCKNVLPGF